MAETGETAERAVTISILEDFYQEILAWCEAEGIPVEEGLRTLLIQGLLYARGEQTLSRLNQGESDLAAELQARIQESADYYGLYSVMKYNAYKFREAASRLDMKVAGLRGELAASAQANATLRAQLQALEAELADLRRQPPPESTPEPAATPVIAPEPPTAPPLSRFWRKLRVR